MKIYSTSDIHGYNIKSMKQIKESSSSILIDNGDFFIGSPEATYWNHHENENPLVQFANAMDYDVMVPGNHDFDYGLEFYLKTIKSLKSIVVSCNIFDTDGNLIFAPYTIIEREGKKYGIIGAMTSTLFQLSMYENVKDIVVADAVGEIKKQVSLIREIVDYVIVSYHGGIECDLKTGKQTQYPTKEDEAYEIANTIEGIDLLICGHQHRENEGKVGDTLVVQIPDRLKKISVVSCDSWENEWIVPEHTHTVNLEAWFNEKIDLNHLESFAQRYLKSDIVHLEIAGETIGDLWNAFSKIKPLHQYQFSAKELSQYEWAREHQAQNSYLVTTNIDLCFSRLKNYTVHNIFDAYYHFITSDI